MPEFAIEDRWIDSPWGRLFSRRWCPAAAPPNPPIVLLHDSLGCVTPWRDFPARLAATTQRQVIAYDRLGYGQSDPHPGRNPYDFIHAEPQRSFAALREVYQLERFALLGHSVGGGMAIACAAHYGEACEALISEAAQAFVEQRTLQGVRAARQAFAPQDQVERLAKYHGDKSAWVLSAWLDTWLAEDFAGWNLDAALRQVHSPLLALHGDSDEYGSAAHPQRIVALANGPTELALLPDCGHVPHKEQADQVLAYCRRWFARQG